MDKMTTVVRQKQKQEPQNERIESEISGVISHYGIALDVIARCNGCSKIFREK